jgi:eukaryotic-like serine/threonine-protein kinase
MLCRVTGRSWGAEGSAGELDTLEGSELVDDEWGGASSEMLTSGTTLGRYQVLDRIGAGAMGVVYAAYDPQLDRRVALKVLHPTPEESSSGSATSRRLVREAQALAKLAHPNVVTVHDAGVADGRVFVAMELVAGLTLRQWCEHAERQWRDVLEKLIVAGRGLAAAHAVGLVHRDFKPDNVIVGDDGRVRVLDFGLARASGHHAPRPAVDDDFDGVAEHLTRTGALMGTPPYMAPEQFLGKAVDARTDQFALCVTIWELVYGERPFRAASAAALGYQVLREDPVPPSDGPSVPAWLHRALLRGLAKSPEERHPSIDALVDALDEQLNPSTLARGRVIAGVVGATVLAAAAGAWIARDGEDGPKCDHAAERMADVWGATQRDAIARAFAAVELAIADDTRGRVITAIDDWAKRWMEGHTDACEATHVRNEQSSASLDLRMRCLEQQRQRLAAHVELLMQADADLVQRSVAATSALGDPAQCSDLERLTRVVPLPDDPTVAKRVEELEDRLERLRALQAAGRYPRLRDELDELAAEAATLGYRALEAKILALQSSTYWKLHEIALALDTTHRGVAAALAGGEPEGIAVSLIAHCRLLAAVDRIEDAQACVELATGATDRAGRGTETEVQLLNAVGIIAIQQGQHDEGVMALQRAVELVEAQEGESHGLVMALHNWGDANRVGQHFEEAARILQRAVDVSERLYGAQHPDVAFSLNSLAVVHMQQGKTEEALQALLRVLEIRKTVFGEEHDFVAGTYNNLAYTHSRGGDCAQALSWWEKALGMRRRSLGEEHPKVGAMRASAAACHLELGQLDDAERRAEQAAAALEGTPHSAEHCNALETLAEVYERRGERGAARQARERCAVEDRVDGD